MRRSIVLVLLFVPACGALATERREEPETNVPVILPPLPGAVSEAPPPPPAPRNASAVPFAAGQTWVGQYACPPGPADLSIRIESVRGTQVAATFRIVSGRYALEGRYDPASGALELTPTRWLEQSPTAPLVGLYGTVSADASAYEGRVTDPTCRWFTLRARASD